MFKRENTKRDYIINFIKDDIVEDCIKSQQKLCNIKLQFEQGSHNEDDITSSIGGIINEAFGKEDLSVLNNAVQMIVRYQKELNINFTECELEEIELFLNEKHKFLYAYKCALISRVTKKIAGTQGVFFEVMNIFNSLELPKSIVIEKEIEKIKLANKETQEPFERRYVRKSYNVQLWGMIFSLLLSAAAVIISIIALSK